MFFFQDPSGNEADSYSRNKRSPLEKDSGEFGRRLSPREAEAARLERESVLSKRLLKIIFDENGVELKEKKEEAQEEFETPEDYYEDDDYNVRRNYPTERFKHV